ncbi:uncharacterized protein Triagg1_1032 [Trichoderma aggressivum f. europaeum]|uniref:Uncharacterized protein n=1 Tax=Trichoderma aggressivum f. europaeum TaxID=173218 RepID=A0AAE1IKJ7_9HYPO|nr:hypothetical protein Triagg1_1032 [Trichoderma aggressivum f. europaeum]
MLTKLPEVLRGFPSQSPPCSYRQPIASLSAAVAQTGQRRTWKLRLFKMTSGGWESLGGTKESDRPGRASSRRAARPPKYRYEHYSYWESQAKRRPAASPGGCRTFLSATSAGRSTGLQFQAHSLKARTDHAGAHRAPGNPKKRAPELQSLRAFTAPVSASGRQSSVSCSRRGVTGDGTRRHWHCIVRVVLVGLSHCTALDCYCTSTYTTTVQLLSIHAFLMDGPLQGF